MEELKNISDFWNTAGQHIYSSVHTLHHQNCKYFWKFLVKPFQPASLSLEDKKSWQGSGNLSDSCWLGLLHIFSSIWQSLTSSFPTYPKISPTHHPFSTPTLPFSLPLPPTQQTQTKPLLMTTTHPLLLLPYCSLIEALFTHHFAFMQPRIDICWICWVHIWAKLRNMPISWGNSVLFCALLRNFAGQWRCWPRWWRLPTLPNEHSSHLAFPRRDSTTLFIHFRHS